MEHAEFVNRCRDPQFVWGVNHIHLVRALGPFGSAVLLALVIIGVAPAAAFVITKAGAGDFVQILWLPLAFIAFMSGVPSLNLISLLPWLAVAALAWLLSRWLGHVVLEGGLICLLTWYTSGIVRGVGMRGLQRRLVRNPKLFKRLRDGRCLILPQA